MRKQTLSEIHYQIQARNGCQSFDSIDDLLERLRFSLENSYGNVNSWGIYRFANEISLEKQHEIGLPRD